MLSAMIKSCGSSPLNGSARVLAKKMITVRTTGAQATRIGDLIRGKNQ